MPGRPRYAHAGEISCSPTAGLDRRPGENLTGSADAEQTGGLGQFVVGEPVGVTGRG
jgi:hypothetical protein